MLSWMGGTGGQTCTFQILGGQAFVARLGLFLVVCISIGAGLAFHGYAAMISIERPFQLPQNDARSPNRLEWSPPAPLPHHSSFMRVVLHLLLVLSCGVTMENSSYQNKILSPRQSPLSALDCTGLSTMSVSNDNPTSAAARIVVSPGLS